MSDELLQAMADKENEINKAEEALEVIQTRQDNLGFEMTELRGKKDEIVALIRSKELESQKLDAPIRMGKRNVARFKRELDALRRQLFRR